MTNHQPDNREITQALVALTTEVRVGFAETKGELKGEIKRVEEELKGEIKRIDKDIASGIIRMFFFSP